MCRLYHFLCIFFLTYTCNAHASDTDPFSPAEKAWIAAHPVVKIAEEPDYQPFTFVQDGRYQGLTTSYLEFVAHVSGLKFAPVPYGGGKRAQLRSDFAAKKIDAIAAAANNPGSMALDFPLLYTSSFYKGNSVIVTRSGERVIPKLHDLAGKMLAVRGGGAYERLIRQEHPEIRFTAFNSQEEALEAVAAGRADAALGLDTVLVPIIRHRYEGRLNVSGVAADVPVKLSIAVRADLPELAAIIDKSLALMTAGQRDELAKKWLHSGDYGIPKWTALLRYYAIELVLAGGTILLMLFLVLRERQARQQAARSEREKSMFLAVMSHEIRSPMNAIISSIELLQEQKPDASTDEILSVAGTASESLLNLLNDLLDFSKLEARRLELAPAPCDVRSLVQDAVDLSIHKARSKGLDIHVKISAPPQYDLVIDGARVRQILINLLSNAIKFSDRGVIHVLATVSDIDGGNGMLSVSVVDYGIGISPEAQKRLFQPFCQANGAEAHHRGGSGLGLSICRELLVLMGGAIELRSQPSFGTTVRFTLPCKVEPASQSAQEKLLPA